jgi:hypothetical protein
VLGPIQGTPFPWFPRITGSKISLSRAKVWTLDLFGTKGQISIPLDGWTSCPRCPRKSDVLCRTASWPQPWTLILQKLSPLQKQFISYKWFLWIWGIYSLHSDHFATNALVCGIWCRSNWQIQDVIQPWRSRFYQLLMLKAMFGTEWYSLPQLNSIQHSALLQDGCVANPKYKSQLNYSNIRW